MKHITTKASFPAHTLQKTHIRVHVKLNFTCATLKIHTKYLKAIVDFKFTNVSRIILYTQTGI